MKIELKNIKISSFLSQETTAYTAALYVDGRKIGTVENDGHGGCDLFSPENGQEDYERFDAAEALSKAATGDDIEMVCAKALDDHETAKDLKRLMKSKILYTKDGGLFEMRWKNCRKLEAKHFQVFAEKYPAIVTLNSMTFEKALAAYKGCAQ